MRIDKQYNEIPDDSFASIQTQGLLGGKYIGISPGGSDTYFKDGGRVDQTQSAIVLESLINKLFAGFADKGGGAQGNGQNSTNSQSDTNSQQGPKK
jgi:phospholipid/cholesterol/gamma-HCH transport system substrate-binding protein